MRLIYFLLFFLIIVSCSRNGTPDPGTGGPHIVNPDDTTNPLVTIFKPMNTQIFTDGDTIKVEGTVTDNGLYRGFIRITQNPAGTVAKEQQYEIHGLQSYNFNLHYKTAVTSATDYTILVQFEDHGFNTGSKSVQVKVNP